ncbi:MAG: hypothetical protein IPN76_35320 [Saprospiraceae bacterium]|nr:hypothetical protein [Saprospiraceae bacterium]
MKLKATAFVASFILSATAFSQEQLGLRLETYAGVSSLAINPVGNLDNPLRWDANLVGAGLFLENNYAFLKNTSLRRLYHHRNDAEFILAEDKEGPTADKVFIADFFNNRAKRFAVANAIFMGPAFAIRIGEQHSVGIFVNDRIMGSSVNIPNQFSYYKYDARPFNESFEIPKLQVAAMFWREFGLNYAFSVPVRNGRLGLGLNLKFIKGIEAAFLETLSPYQHTRQPGNIITVGLPNSRFGFAQGTSFQNNIIIDEASGRGLGLDLGISYQAKESKLKLSASLMDLGRIKFDNEAQAHRLDLDSTISIDFDDYEQFKSRDDLEEIVQNFGQNSLSDPDASLDGTAFKMVLPTALNLQADYGVTEQFYVNALLMQRLPTFNIGPKRGNLLAVTPRWQHRWFSASVPVSVYNWSSVHVGLAARLGWLVIGSDDMASWFFNKNLTGADFYIALKVNPFNIGKGRASGLRKRHFGGKGKVKCYSF